MPAALPQDAQSAPSRHQNPPRRIGHLFGLLAALATIEGTAQSTIPASDGYAYAANSGWLTFSPSPSRGVVVGTRYLSGWAHAANAGWIHLGDGAPVSGFAYSQAGGDFGVNQASDGRLTGYAYGANIGWINFSWAAENDPQQPRIDLTTGLFVGYAYSANTGWLLLGTGELLTTRIAVVDTDSDFIDDADERRWFGDLDTAGPGTDFDGDGQSDAAELIANTSPINPTEFMRVTQLNATTNTQFTLVFTSSSGRYYRIQHSTDLATWADSDLGRFAPDAGATTTRQLSFPTPALRRFFRVTVERPLPP